MPFPPVTPTADQTPIAFWFWNGELTPAEVRRQVVLMGESGVLAFVIHARKGFGSDPSGLKTAYLSEEWFAACEAAIDEADRRGMKVWLYDEINWPSGSAGGIVTVEKGLSEWHIASDGTLSQDFDVSWKPAISPDFLSERSARAFLESTHEEYARRYSRYFGTTILGVFNDEIRLANAEPWSPDLPDHRTFSRADKIRKAGQAFRQAYLKTLSDWCTDHGLKHMGHLMGEETLASQVRYLAGDMMSMVNLYHVPGIDHLGTKAEGLHPLYLASAAFLRGDNPVTISETGAGLPWEVSETDLRRVTGWLFAQGVGRQVLHGFFYDANPKDWSPDLFYRWSNWGSMKPYTAWASRIQAYRDRLVPTYQVALYYPVEEFIDAYEPNTKFTLDFKTCDPVSGPRALELHRLMQSVPQSLRADHIDFVFVTKDQLDTVAEMLLIVPQGCKVDFSGRTLIQGNLSANQVCATVRRLVPGLPQVEGPRANPKAMAIRDDFADPYLHSEEDEEGVLLKSYRDGACRVLSLWNANPTPFVGTLRVGTEPSWSTWDPDSDQRAVVAAVQGQIAVNLAPYSMRYFREESEV